MAIWPFTKKKSRTGKGRTPVTPSYLVPEPRGVIVDDSTSYRRELARMIDQLPWFGGPPFEVSASTKAPRSGDGGDGYLRRVMVSWLIGRPVSQVAERAGCSVRYVYRVIDEWFYTSRPMRMILSWIEIGLLGVLDGPYVNYEPSDRELFRDAAGPFRMALACLVCHRPVGGVTVHDELRRHDGSLRNPVDLDFEIRRVEGIAEIQGHLIGHFLKDRFPIRPTSSSHPRPTGRHWTPDEPLEDYWLRRQEERVAFVKQRAAHEKRRRAMQRAIRAPWDRTVWAEVNMEVRRYRTAGPASLYPTVGGQTMAREVAVRFWADCLRGRFKAPRGSQPSIKE